MNSSTMNTKTPSNFRRPPGITILEGDGEMRRQREERSLEEENPIDPHGKHFAGEEKHKKQKKGPTMGTYTTKSNTQISVPWNHKEEELQLRETLERNMVKK